LFKSIFLLNYSMSKYINSIDCKLKEVGYHGLVCIVQLVKLSRTGYPWPCIGTWLARPGIGDERVGHAEAP